MIGGYSAFRLMWAVVPLVAIWIFLGKSVENARIVSSGDPVQFADWGLSHASRSDFEREIRSTLDEGKVDLAQDILTEARNRNLFLEPALTESVRQANVSQSSATVRTARSFASGVLTGEAADAAGFIGATASDAVFVGDFRDLGREGYRCLFGERCDSWILGVAACGVVVTLATYATSGAAAPERIGLSLLKDARRLSRLNPRLLQSVAARATEGGSALIDLAAGLGVIEANAGAEGVFDALAFAETPEDVMLLSRLAVAKGRGMRVALRLLERGAHRAEKVAEDLVKQLLWLAAAFLGFSAWLKSSAERAMERYLLRRRIRLSRKCIGSLDSILRTSPASGSSTLSGIIGPFSPKPSNGKICPYQIMR